MQAKKASHKFSFELTKENAESMMETPPSAALKKRLCGVFSLFAAYFKGFTLLFTNFCEKSSQKFRDFQEKPNVRRRFEKAGGSAFGFSSAALF